MNKIWLNIFFFVLSSVFFFSCAKEDITVTNSAFHSVFSGSYRFKFNTGMSGNGILTVDEEGNIKLPMSISVSGMSYNVNINGNVKNSGILNGEIYRDSVSIGTLEGQLYIPGEGGGSSTINGSFGYWTAMYIY